MSEAKYVRLAVVAHDDAIFFVTVIGGAEPQCTVFLVDVAAGPQAFDGTRDRAVVVSERSENHSL